MAYLSKISGVNYWHKKLSLSNFLTVLLDCLLVVPWLLVFSPIKGKLFFLIKVNQGFLLISHSSQMELQVLLITVMEIGLITISMVVIITMEAIKGIILEAKAEGDFNTILVQEFQMVILAFLVLPNQSHCPDHPSDIPTCHICNKKGHVVAYCFQRHTTPTSCFPTQCQIYWKYGHTTV